MDMPSWKCRRSSWPPAAQPSIERDGPIFSLRCRKKNRNSANESVISKPSKRHTSMKKILILSAVAVALALTSAKAEDAKARYEKNCAKCHGPDGKGQTKMGQKLGIKDYTDAKVQAELKDEAATKATKKGLKDKKGKVLMKPAEGLNDDDIKGLVGVIRSFKK